VPGEPAASSAGPAARAPEDLGGRLETLREVLGSLPAAEVELLRRRFLARQTLGAVSEATGVPVSTLHGRERALLVKLRRLLEARERGGGGS